MSKICLIFHLPYASNKLASYYDQFTKALNKHHNLLVINFSNTSKYDELCNNKIKEFEPDLIITYNNVINDFIIENTNCFILIVESDLYPNGFHNIDLMSKYKDRIYIGTDNNNLRNRIKKLINFIKDDRFIVVKNSTSFLDYEEKNFPQDINISFVGTVIGLENNEFVDFLEKNSNDKDKLNFAKEIIKLGLYNIDNVQLDDLEKNKINYISFFHYISYLNRVKVLESICDLGLVLFSKTYGMRNIAKLGNLIFSINEINDILCASENKDIYDRSKLSINLHFAHNSIDPNLSSYSWRVPDIMASNSCLVSTFCPALDQDFSKWVKIPQFSNKFEAYDICRKLLSDESWRKDIVENSKIAIKEGGFTFDERVREIEQIFSLIRNKEEDNLKLEFFISKDKNSFEQSSEAIQENMSVSIGPNLTIPRYKKRIIKIIKKIFENLFIKITSRISNKK